MSDDWGAKVDLREAYDVLKTGRSLNRLLPESSPGFWRNGGTDAFLVKCPGVRDSFVPAFGTGFVSQMFRTLPTARLDRQRSVSCGETFSFIILATLVVSLIML